MSDNRNTILAVILSGLVLIAWQYWYNIPQMEKQRAAQQAQQQTGPAAPGTTPGTTPPAPTTPEHDQKPIIQTTPHRGHPRDNGLER